MTFSGSSATFDLLTTTRYDVSLMAFRWNDDEEGPSPFFFLPRHLERLLLASTRHGWTRAKLELHYITLKRKCQDAIRICVSQDGNISVSATHIPPFTHDPLVFSSVGNPPLPDYAFLAPTLKIHIDTQATQPSIYTTTKTTNRTSYDNARLRNNVPLLLDSNGTLSDVLLYNVSGFIMETTIYNVAFYRLSQWITPSSSTGCLCGVLRSWLLEHDRIKEDTEALLTKESIYRDEWVLLFNGVQGCRIGKIVCQ
ncbi:aminotransferase [Cyathus striatus]|nr:aminotransferase [Cyathus striatus]